MEERILSWLTDHFFEIKMAPKKPPKKTKKGEPVGISPLKKTVTARKAKKSDKSDISGDDSQDTPVKVKVGKVKKPAAEKKKLSSKKKLTLITSEILITTDNQDLQIDNADTVDTEFSVKATADLIASTTLTEANLTVPLLPQITADVSTEGVPPKPREVMFNFTDDQKSHLFDWLRDKEMLPISNKEYHINSQEWQNALTAKAADYKTGDIICNGRQLYNMFKTQRRCYTNFNKILNKSGQEAAPKLEKAHTPLQKHIIDIYTKHAQSSGIIPVTRKRRTRKSKVSISCIILNI